MIYVDEPQLGNIVLDFPNYVQTISDIILHSTPQFTVGIFGEWGTGKSTLMKNIMRILEQSNCNCLEFNAWRYEGEQRIATYPLMLSIIGRILREPKIREFIEKQPQLIRETIGQKVIRVLKGLSGNVTFKIPGFADVQVGIDPSKMTNENKIFPLDIYTFYNENKPVLQEGVELIQEFLSMIQGPEFNHELKIIVFIDDLDRCTPEKAAEVFESIKVFFDLRGMVFVLGLSKSVIEAAIDLKYQHFKRDVFSGSDYLKKIIQVPFTIPTWTTEDIRKYLKVLLDTHENPFSDFLKDNIDLISHLVESNPREVKRLLNNFVLSRKINETNTNVESNTLLVLQALGQRWRWFHDAIFADTSYPKIVYRVIEIKNDLFDIKGSIKSIERQNYPLALRPILETMNQNTGLIKFLVENKDIILNIKEEQWSEYRRATNIIEPQLSEKGQSEESFATKIQHDLNSELYKLQSEISRKEVEYTLERPRFGFLTAGEEKLKRLKKLKIEIRELRRKQEEVFNALSGR